ncbi:MAG: sigma factor-like helix-turn-helix DNA-binding protein [Bacillota bacterium]
MLPGLEPLYRRLLLYAFYGNLLTERQKALFEMRFHQDFSLGEIAENLQISRAAVCDGLHRAECELEEIERKLGLVEQFLQQRSALSRLEGLLSSLTVTECQQGLLEEARSIVRWLLEGSND